MNLKNILAENMLRFGVKNLDDITRNKIIEQIEQADGRNLQAIPIIGVALEEVDKYISTNSASIRSINGFAKKLVSSGQVEEKTQYDLIGQLESNPLYSKLINALCNAGGKLIYSNLSIWFKTLNQESRLAFLNQFTNWWNESSKKIQKGKLSIVATLGKAGSRLDKTEIPAVKQEPVGIPPVLATIVKGNTVYIDNKSDITPTLQAEIDLLVKSAAQSVTVAKENGGTVTCLKLKVASSASRFRNTKEASDMTWADLSKARGMKVVTELKSRLQAVGVIVPDNVVTELLGGTNGDGTSGPNPPKSLGQLTTDGKTITTDEKLRNKFGQPLSSKDQYDQYKFCIIECILQPNESSIPVTVVPQFEYQKFKQYEMSIRAYETKRGTGGGRTRDFNTIEWKIPREKISRARKEMLACKEPN